MNTKILPQKEIHQVDLKKMAMNSENISIAQSLIALAKKNDLDTLEEGTPSNIEIMWSPKDWNWTDISDEEVGRQLRRIRSASADFIHEPKQRPRFASFVGSEASSTSSSSTTNEELEMATTVASLGDYSWIQQHDENKMIGNYSPRARRKRIERFAEKRKRRVWRKKVDYGVRKNFADSRLRVKGRFVKKEDEAKLCLLLGLT